jgi:DNA-binding transcriptional regulator PaaX
MVTSRADLVANQRGVRPRNRTMASRMTASVHSLVDATRKPNENVDAVIRHYKAINDELEAQLAVALAQRDAWRELVEHCWQLVDAERKRWFK